MRAQAAPSLTPLTWAGASCCPVGCWVGQKQGWWQWHKGHPEDSGEGSGGERRQTDEEAEV